MTVDPAKTPQTVRFVKLYLDFLGRTDLTSGAKIVFAVVRDAMRDKGRSWPGCRKIGKIAGMNFKAVLRAIAELEEKGALVVERSGGRPNIYKLGKVTAPISGAVSKRDCSRNGIAAAPKTGAELLPKRDTKQTKPDELKQTKVRRASATSPEGRVREFLTWFAQHFKEQNRRDYVIIWKREGAIVKRLLESLSLDDLKAAAKTMLGDDWGGERADIGLLLSQINRWRAGPAKSKTSTKFLPAQPGATHARKEIVPEYPLAPPAGRFARVDEGATKSDA